MKIALIYIGDFRVCPFIHKYIKVLKEQNVEIEAILWHRIPEEDNNTYFDNVKIHEYDGTVNNQTKIGKVLHSIKYRKYIKKLLKTENYDKLIILTTLTGILLEDILTKEYKNRYIFDFRDITYEKFNFVKKNVIKLCKNSYFTALSSKGFKNVLGEGNYFIAHNFNYYDIENSISNKDFKKKNKLNIVYIGMIREYAMCERMINLFGNDKRFNLIIHGGGDCFKEVKEIADKYDNIKMTGTYKYTEKPKLLKDADLLAYFYPNNSVNKYAIANKFYDGMMYKIPTIGNKATYSGQKIEELGVGCSIDWNDKNENIKEQIFNYYNNIDSDKFNENANNYMREVIIEDKKYLNKIDEFIKS